MSQVVLFDLDGTLTDPAEGITNCIAHALRELDREVPPAEDLLWCIGPPLRESFETLLGTGGDPDQAVALYRERFSTTGLFENRVYAGIPALLDELKQDSFRLILATSKPHVYARRICEHFGLDAYLRAIHGAELDGLRSAKTDLIAWISEVEGFAAQQAVMVGDRRHDMAGAHANGMRAIGVTWGYGSRAELVQAGASTLVASPAALGRALIASAQ